MCINRELVLNQREQVSLDEAITALKIRGEKIVSVSGGEPFADSHILNLLEKLNSSGFMTAISTNGFYPDLLKEAIEAHLLYFVQMDIKAIPTVESYSAVSGVSLSEEDLAGFNESLRFLRDECQQKTSRYFRTTVCSKFVSKSDLFKIAELVGKGCIYVLQPFEIHQTLSASVANPEYCVPFETLEEWACEINPLVMACVVRDV